MGPIIVVLNYKEYFYVALGVILIPKVLSAVATVFNMGAFYFANTDFTFVVQTLFTGQSEFLKTVFIPFLEVSTSIDVWIFVAILNLNNCLVGYDSAILPCVLSNAHER